MTSHDALPMPLVEQALDRMGLEAMPTEDPEGLTVLYRAWCRSVPFDNTQKLIALHGQGGYGALPGMDAGDFLRTWLRHGTGGTCFPSANALHELALSCGFDSRVVLGSMWDMGMPTHGTTVVDIEGSSWLIDSSMLTDVPLQLAEQTLTSIDHPVHASTAEPVEEGWLLHFSAPYADDLRIPCRTLSPSTVDQATLVERFEASRESSPFNSSPSTRRNDDAGVISYGGGKRYRRTVAGVEVSDLTGDELSIALVEELGLSEEIVQRLAEVLDGDTTA